MTKPCGSGLLLKALQEALAAAVNQIKYGVESAHVVGVWHITSLGVRGKIKQPNDSVLREVRRSSLSKMLFIGGIHGDDPVVFLEVGALELSRALVIDRDPSFLSDRNGSRMRRLSCMPASGSTRVD